MQINCKKHGIQDLIFYRTRKGIIKKKCQVCDAEKKTRELVLNTLSISAYIPKPLIYKAIDDLKSKQ